MLPAPCKDTPAIPTDCPNCDALEKVKKALEKLRECATDKEDDAGDEQAEEGAEDAAEDAAEDGAEDEGGECMEPPMFSMDLILANEELDKSIAELYNQIIQVQGHNSIWFSIHFSMLIHSFLIAKFLTTSLMIVVLKDSCLILIFHSVYE